MLVANLFINSFLFIERYYLRQKMNNMYMHANYHHLHLHVEVI